MLKLKIRQVIRTISRPFLWRGYRWYLSKDRWYHYEGLQVKVNKSVFHPGLLLSTKFLVEFALALPLKGRRVLELGAGSGLLALAVSREGAAVTASDINPAAITSLEESGKENKLDITLYQSDLFDEIPSQLFDYIFINPPYYPREPKNEREYAFFCGEDHAYFKKLFRQMGDYISPSSAVYMVLSEDCNIEEIRRLAEEALFSFERITAEKKLGEWQSVYLLSAQS